MWLGRCAGCCTRDSTPPSLKGQQPASRRTSYFRPPGRPCRKESQTISLIPFRIPWIATAVGCQSTHARLRSSSRGGQPALASTRAPGARDHQRATGPRVYKSSLTWSHRGQPALVTTTGLSARDHKRATGPRVYKSSSTGPSGDNQSRRNPDLPVSFHKKNYPSRHALRNQGHHLGLTKATGHRVRTGAPAQPEGERTNTWDLRRQPALVSAQKLHLNQRVSPMKTNETFNTGRTPDHVTSKLEKKPQHKGCR